MSDVEIKLIDVDLAKELKAVIKSTGKYALDEVKARSPVGYTGDYKNGWKLKITQNGLRATVHNPEEYRLTHLLEFGHITRRGKMTRSQPHIEPAYKLAVNEYEKEAKKIKIENKTKKG